MFSYTANFSLKELTILCKIISSYCVKTIILFLPLTQTEMVNLKDYIKTRENICFETSHFQKEVDKGRIQYTERILHR